jgi:hypothetical protein
MRHAIVLTLGFVLGLACSLAEELEGAACNGDGDCDKSQSCERTLHQEIAGGAGSCSSKGGCVEGEQPGCTCADRACTNFELMAVEHSMRRDENNAPECFCCPSTVCSAEQEPVIIDVAEDGSAQCTCCDRCPDGEIHVLEEDGDVDEGCGCMPDPEAVTGSDSGSSG